MRLRQVALARARSRRRRSTISARCSGSKSASAIRASPCSDSPMRCSRSATPSSRSCRPCATTPRPARLLARRGGDTRLHGDRPGRRSRRRARADRSANRCASSSSTRTPPATPRRSTCTRATSAARSSRSTSRSRPRAGTGPDASGSVTCAATSSRGSRARRSRATTPAGLAAHWASLLDRPASALGGGVFAIALDGATLRFVPGARAGEGLVGVDLVEASRAARERALATARSAGCASRATRLDRGNRVALVEARP